MSGEGIKVVDVPGFSDIHSTEQLASMPEDPRNGGQQQMAEGDFNPPPPIVPDSELPHQPASSSEDAAPEWLQSYLESIGAAPEAPPPPPQSPLAALGLPPETAAQVQALLQAEQSRTEAFRMAAEMATRYQQPQAPAIQQAPAPQPVAPVAPQPIQEFNPKLLPEFQALRNADPEHFWDAFEKYEDAKSAGEAQYRQARMEAMVQERLSGVVEQQRELELQQESERFRTNLKKEWNGQSLANPIPFDEIENIFNEMATRDHRVFDAVASQPNFTARAMMMKQIVHEARPEVLAKHVARIISKSAAKAQPSVDKLRASTRAAGQSSPLKSQPGSPGAKTPSSIMMDWIHSKD